MNERLKRIAKNFLPEEEKERDAVKELRVSGGYVQTDNQPYDRLRRSLKRLFPGYPTVFDYNDDEDEKH